MKERKIIIEDIFTKKDKELKIKFVYFVHFHIRTCSSKTHIFLCEKKKRKGDLTSPLCTPLGGMIYEVLFKTGA